MNSSSDSTDSGKAGSDDSTPAGDESRLYSSRVTGSRQLKTTDLLPKRPMSYAMVVLSLLALVVGLNALDHFASDWRPWIGDVGVEALTISGSGSLANWFLSFLFIASAMASLQIYALRRHRCDDYRGAYRIWLWFAAILLLGSSGCVIRIGEICQNLLTHVASPEWIQSVIVLIAIKLTILSLVALRGIFEVRASKGALVVLSISFILLVATVCFELPSLRSRLADNFELTHGNMLLSGVVCMFLGQLTFARFVYLEARGLVRQPLAKAQKESSETNGKKRESVQASKPAARSGSKPTKARKSTSKKQKSKSDPVPAPEPVPVPSVSDQGKLKQILAARAEKAASAASNSSSIEDIPASKPLNLAEHANAIRAAQSDPSQSGSTESTRNLSKSEQRRLRKLQKRQRKAA